MPSRHVVDRRLNNAEFRHRTQPPLPAIDELERELYRLLSVAAFTPLRVVQSSPALRDRTLTLPVMTAVVVSLVLRGIASQQELLRLLKQEGLLWTGPVKVSKQALSQRFSTLPAELFAAMLSDVIERYEQERWQHEQTASVLQLWQRRVDAAFSVVWTADTSTLEAIRRTTTWLQQPISDRGERLGGMIHAIVETMTSAPVHIEHDSNPQADELSGVEMLLDRMPEEGLVVVDEGYFQFLLFDRFSDAGKFFLTRMRKQVNYRSVALIAEGNHYRDEIIECGQWRSHPCGHQLRLISVRWSGTWYRYVTNVLDEDRLCAEDACRLYRSRWRIETAFKEVKRLLGLSYLWVSDSNGIQLQLYATWIIYSVLVQLSWQVAQRLGTTLDLISYEMVYRSLYHYSQACLRGEATDVLSYLVSNSKLLGLVKERRNRHRLRDQHWAAIWGYT